MSADLTYPLIWSELLLVTDHHCCVNARNGFNRFRIWLVIDGDDEGGAAPAPDPTCISEEDDSASDDQEGSSHAVVLDAAWMEARRATGSVGDPCPPPDTCPAPAPVPIPALPPSGTSCSGPLPPHPCPLSVTLSEWGSSLSGSFHAGSVNLADPAAVAAAAAAVAQRQRPLSGLSSGVGGGGGGLPGELGRAGSCSSSGTYASQPLARWSGGCQSSGPLQILGRASSGGSSGSSGGVGGEDAAACAPVRSGGYLGKGASSVDSSSCVNTVSSSTLSSSRRWGASGGGSSGSGCGSGCGSKGGAAPAPAGSTCISCDTNAMSSGPWVSDQGSGADAGGGGSVGGSYEKLALWIGEGWTRFQGERWAEVQGRVLAGVHGEGWARFWGEWEWVRALVHCLRTGHCHHGWQLIGSCVAGWVGSWLLGAGCKLRSLNSVKARSMQSARRVVLAWFLVPLLSLLLSSPLHSPREVGMDHLRALLCHYNGTLTLTFLCLLWHPSHGCGTTSPNVTTKKHAKNAKNAKKNKKTPKHQKRHHRLSAHHAARARIPLQSWTTATRAV